MDRSKWSLMAWIFVTCLTASAYAQLPAELSIRQIGEDFILENRFLRVRVEPLGGKIVEFLDKEADLDYAQSPADADKLWRGFLKDRIWERMGQTEMIRSNYQLSIIRQTQNEVVLEAKMTASEGDVAGLQFTKRYMLRRDHCTLEVNCRVQSQGAWAELTPWLHNVFNLRGSPEERENQTIYAQTRKGVYVAHPAVYSGPANNLLLDLREPWVALTNRQTGDGLLVGVQPAERLSRFFIWMGHAQAMTVEPVLAQTKLSPDESVEATIYFTPFHGLPAVELANANYVAGFTRQDNQAILEIYPAVNLGKTTVTVKHQTQTIGQAEMVLQTGVLVRLPVKLPDVLTDISVTIATANKHWVHHVRAAAAPYESEVEPPHNLAVQPSDEPAQVYSSHIKDRIYISPDSTTVTTFALRHTFTQPGPVELIFEIPEGVTVRPYSEPGRSHATRQTIIEENGQVYQRYIVKGPLRNDDRWVTLLLDTDQKEGWVGDAYFYARWENENEHKHHIVLESVHIEPAPVPRRLITNLNWSSIQLLEAWPSYFKDMKQLGVNTYALKKNDLDAAVDSVAGSNQLVKTINQARAAGMYVAGNTSPFLSHSVLENAKLESAVAMSIDGVPNSRGLICPSYRGPAFQKEIQRISEYGHYGVSILWYDAEIWKGASYCFCPRCLSQFRQYKLVHYPGLSDLSPKKFEKNPLDHPQFHQAWEEFRVALGTEMFSLARQAYDKKLESQSLRTSPEVIVGSYGMLPHVIYHQFLRLDEQVQAGALNAAMPSLYTGGNALIVGDVVREIRMDANCPNIIPWLSAGYGSLSSECDSVDVKYMVLENFMNGARGFTFFTWYGVDGMDMRYLAEAMRMIVPVEDILMDGKSVKVSASTPAARTLAIQNQHEILLLVAEYRTDKTIVGNVEIPADIQGRIIDMETYEDLGEYKSGTPLSFCLDKHRIKLFYIGNRIFPFKLDHGDM